MNKKNVVAAVFFWGFFFLIDDRRWREPGKKKNEKETKDKTTTTKKKERGENGGKAARNLHRFAYRGRGGGGGGGGGGGCGGDGGGDLLRRPIRARPDAVKSSQCDFPATAAHLPPAARQFPSKARKLKKKKPVRRTFVLTFSQPNVWTFRIPNLTSRPSRLHLPCFDHMMRQYSKNVNVNIRFLGTPHFKLSYVHR